jgi:hypothetical protein
MGPRCSSAETQVCHRSYIIAAMQDFLDRRLLLTRKLLNQGFLLVKLKSSLRKFYGRHHDLVDRDRISVSPMTTDMFHLHVATYKWKIHDVKIENISFVVKLNQRLSVMDML